MPRKKYVSIIKATIGTTRIGVCEIYLYPRDLGLSSPGPELQLEPRREQGKSAGSEQAGTAAARFDMVVDQVVTEAGHSGRGLGFDRPGTELGRSGTGADLAGTELGHSGTELDHAGWVVEQLEWVLDQRRIEVVGFGSLAWRLSFVWRF